MLGETSWQRKSPHAPIQLCVEPALERGEKDPHPCRPHEPSWGQNDPSSTPSRLGEKKPRLWGIRMARTAWSPYWGPSTLGPGLVQVVPAIFYWGVGRYLWLKVSVFTALPKPLPA